MSQKNLLSSLLSGFTYPRRWHSPWLRARVISMRSPDSDHVVISLKVGWRWQPHQPGQHILVRVTIDGVVQERAFSICSAPAKNYVELAVKENPAGTVSRHFNRALKVGARLKVSQADGNFIGAGSGKSLFISGGSGITPFHSMVTGSKLPDCVHIHFDRGTPMLADSLCATPQSRYRFIAVNPDQQGRFSEALMTQLCPDWRERSVWLCGPSKLMQAVQAALKPHPGIALHTEHFATPTADEQPPITIKLASRAYPQTVDNNASLLELVEALGARPRFGCRAGQCGSCESTLLEGHARHMLTNESVAAPSLIRICCHQATTDVSLNL